MARNYTAHPDSLRAARKVIREAMKRSLHTPPRGTPEWDEMLRQDAERAAKRNAGGDGGGNAA